MRILRFLPLFVLLALALCAAAAFAEDAKPIQVAFFNPVQIFPEKTSVSGLRVNFIYGVNQNVTGVDWGLVNHVRGDGFAWQVGGLGYVERNFTGWQDNYINVVKGEFTGFQCGFYNGAGSGDGVQLGFVNNTTSMRGLQVGVLNMTQTMHGLQVGIANMIQKGKTPFLPLVNWSR